MTSKVPHRLQFLSLSFGLLFLVLTKAVSTQKSNVLTLLEDQMDAFNQQDIDRLVGNVSDDFIWFSLTTNQLLVETKGKDAFKQSMVKYFKSHQSRKSISTIISYSIQGKRISFNEQVQHQDKNGKKITASAMGSYQIEKRKISRAWYFID